MTRDALVKTILLTVVLALSMISSSAIAKLPWDWKKIKPGMSPENVLKIIPKGKLVKDIDTRSGEQTQIVLTGFSYVGTAYRADFFFKDQRLRRIRMEPDYSSNLLAFFPPLGEASRQIDEFRADALKARGKKVSSTIDLNRKNKFGNEVFQSPEWSLEIACMPFSFPDVAEIRVSFTANE